MDRYRPAGSPSGRPNKLTIALIVSGAVIVILSIVLGLLFMQREKVKTGQDPAKSAQVIKQVGRIYQLPASEEPTVAQIQDKTKLTGQAFFNDAQNGDYVLVYKTAKLALLYREKDHKLINVMPINDSQTPGQPQTK